MSQKNHWSRREMLALAGAAGTGALLPRVVSAQEKKPDDKKIPLIVSPFDGSKLGSAGEFEFLQKVVDALPAPFYVWSTDGVLLLANQGWEEDTGIKRPDALGKLCTELFPKDMAQRFLEVNKEVVETKRAVETDEFVTKKDGRHQYLTVKFPIRDAKGRIVAVGGVSFKKKA